MIGNLVLGLLTMAVCLVIQALLLAYAAQFYAWRRDESRRHGVARTMLLIIAVMVLLVVGNVIQIAIWAGLFQYLGEFDDFALSVYHSAVNFATLGYGDIVMSDAHRLLGPLEAVNGVLMIGVSTAAVMAVLQDSLKMSTTPQE